MASQTNVKVLCTRSFQNKIADSVFTLLKERIYHYGIQASFTFTQSRITNKYTGSTFLFYGLSRNTAEIKSLEGVDICYVEEAQFITEEQFNILSPTIRKEGSELIFCFNPDLVTDFIYDKFVVNTPENARIRHINYQENPYLSGTMLQDIAYLEEQDKEAYNHVFLGHAKGDDDLAIIKRSWVLGCIGAKEKLEKLGFSFNNREKIIGYDVADDGGDTNAYCVKEGMELTDLTEWKAGENELFRSSRKVFARAVAERAKIYYDNIGVGAGVGANIEELNKTKRGRIRHYKFTAGNAPVQPNQFYRVGKMKTKDKNGQYFENIKAQAFILFADKLKATIRALEGSTIEDPADFISLSPHLPLLSKLVKELCSPRRVTSLNNKNAVEKKSDMLKRGIKSPNLADCVIMTTVKLHGNGFSDSM